MKKTCLSLFLLAAVLTGSTQDTKTRITFNHADNYHFSMYWKPNTKVNEWDSIAFYRSQKLYSEAYVYRGYMNNNEFNGYGEISSKSMEYKGTWKDGRPHGYGHLVLTHALLKKIEFKGTFNEGRPVEGLSFIVSRDNIRTTFYSGEVIYEDGKLLWHGWGQVLRLEQGEWDKMGVKGAFYAGQFYRSAATGFGITNTAEMNGAISNLSTALVLADRVVKTFDLLPVRTDHLVENSYTPPVSAGLLQKILPQYTSATRVNIPLDTIARYKGTAIRNTPYGLGMVEYRDGFVDFGFWREGRKIPVRELLASLLPDSSVLVAKEREELTRQIVYNPETKKSRASVEWEWKKKKVVYYAPVNSSGRAQGWGWKYIPGDESPIQGGNFNGQDISRKGDFNADTMYIQVPFEVHKTAYPGLYHGGGGYVEYTARQNYFMETSERWMLIAYRIMRDKPYAMEHEKMFNYKNGIVQVAYADDRFYRQEAMAYMQQYIDQNKAQVNAFQNLPRLLLTRVQINLLSPSASFVTDGKTQVKVEYVNSNDIKRFDYVLVGDQFKPVSEVFSTYILLQGNSSLNRDAGTGYYCIRNYQLVYQSQDWKCKECNGTGGHTAEAKVNVVTGYNNYINHTGPQTATVVSTPVYTQIGGLSYKSVCKACNGVGQGKTSITKTEIIK
jgi:hypothetical protein